MPARTLPLLLWALLLAACSNTPVYTDIDQGRLEGYIDEEVEYYLGVPYAQPPLGKLRWRPPVPAKPWNGTLRARKNPTPCTQFSPLGGGLTGSEDCLYLNIWTPTEKPDKPMPVMVWIHGGGFIVGQGSYFEAEGGQLLRG
jgi:para-nitrobenzyl esterase